MHAHRMRACVAVLRGCGELVGRTRVIACTWLTVTQGWTATLFFHFSPASLLLCAHGLHPFSRESHFYYMNMSPLCSSRIQTKGGGGRLCGGRNPPPSHLKFYPFRPSDIFFVTHRRLFVCSSKTNHRVGRMRDKNEITRHNLDARMIRY